MLFEGPEEFRDALKRHTIAEQKQFDYARNTQKQIRAKCAVEGCPWVVYASYDKQTNSFRVKTYNSKHTCGVSFVNKRVKSNLIAQVFLPILRVIPNIKLLELKNLVRTQMGVNVSKDQCRRAREKVHEILMGSYEKEYAMLWDYIEELCHRNPGSTIMMRVQRDDDFGKPKFDRLYICFKGLRDGFLAGCRRVIGLDGCFLKGVCKGELLSAIGRDANNQMYPIAWAIVRSESKDTWTWFLRALMEDLQIDEKDGREWTFITDQQKGLLPAIHDLLPNAEHRMCARHIYANWGKRHRGAYYKKIFWSMAKATTLPDFEAVSQRLAGVDKEAWKDLMKTEPRHWCKAFFRTDMGCDIVDNNLCEAFNGKILEARCKAIVTMLEEIRIYVKGRIQKQREGYAKWTGKICPRIAKRLEENKEKSRWCEVYFGGDSEFEIQYDGDRYTVDLDNKTCVCREWDLTGIPCCHAICAIVNLCRNPEDYVDENYHKETFRKIYIHTIASVRGEKFWKKTGAEGPKPLPKRSKRGRLPKNRKKEDIEQSSLDKLSRKGRPMSCTLCKQIGHNRRGCPLTKGYKKKQCEQRLQQLADHRQVQHQDQQVVRQEQQVVRDEQQIEVEGVDYYFSQSGFDKEEAADIYNTIRTYFESTPFPISEDVARLPHKQQTYELTNQDVVMTEGGVANSGDEEENVEVVRDDMEIASKSKGKTMKEKVVSLRKRKSNRLMLSPRKNN